jgi:hypothetical protein
LRDYPIDYVATDSNKRRNQQRNTILIIRMKKAQQRSAAAAEIDAGEIDLFGKFSQSQASSDFSPARPRRKKRLASKGMRGNEVYDDEDDDNNDDDDGGYWRGGGGGGREGGGAIKGKKKFAMM